MLITIITISYNNLKGLKRTMVSVLEQSYSNVEYIVIDGGSSDGSKQYIESKEQNLSYWVSEPDTGIYNAMNKGIEQATGEYLLFLNSGDELVGKEILTKSIPNFLNYDLVYFDIKVFTQNKSFIKSYPNILTFSYMFNDSLPHPATFIKRKWFDVVGYYDENLKIVSDWKFFLLATCKYQVTYKHMNMVLSNFYLDGVSSLQSNRSLIKEERDKVLETEFSIFVDDMKELNLLTSKANYLRNSKKIKLLVKLGLINKF